MEIGTGLALLGSTIGSVKIVEKILGPTADYLGDSLKNWTEKRVKNVARIFEIARIRLGERVNEPGSVPPKILKGILDEGSFCDDSLSAEYFGGVLASSRTEVGRDDRGAVYIALLTKLSAYQIRTHFIFYLGLLSLYRNLDLKIGSDKNKLVTFLSADSYQRAMEYNQSESRMGGALFGHALSGLVKEDLLWRNVYAVGSDDYLKSIYSRYSKKITTAGFNYAPSELGSELFLWVHGISNKSYNDFFNLDFSINLETDIQIPKDYISLNS